MQLLNGLHGQDKVEAEKLVNEIRDGLNPLPRAKLIDEVVRQFFIAEMQQTLNAQLFAILKKHNIDVDAERQALLAPKQDEQETEQKLEEVKTNE